MSINISEIEATLNDRLDEAGLSNIVEFDLEDRNIPNTVYLASIYCNVRSEGNGTKALKLLLAMANEFSFNINLSVAGDESEDEDEYTTEGPGFWILKLWYESLGFEYIGDNEMRYTGA